MAERLTRRQYIFSQWDCVTFATDVLGWHLVKGNTRAKSLAGQGHSGNEALSISPDVWFDHKLQVGGTVIDLCAYAMFGGDVARAMDYLAGDFYDVDCQEWRRVQEQVASRCVRWHEKLSDDDREYLHSRRINDDTIERLQIGTMFEDEYGRLTHRIVIPYFKNNRIAYYISRDRTGVDSAAKYKKCALPKDKNTKEDKEILQNIPWGLHTLNRRTSNYQVTLDDYGVNKQDWLIIAEGIFDAMSFEQEGYIVFGTGGGHFSPSVINEVLGHAKTFPHVLIIFDNDGAGSKFQRDMSQKFFANRISFNVGYVPSQYNGQDIKDVSDYYCAGGELADLIKSSVQGLDVLAESITDPVELRSFLYTTARYADKSDVIELYQKIKARKVFNPFWLKVVLDESTKAPAETVIVRELSERHNMKYIENSGFFEYQHGVWCSVSDNRVKSYADKALGRYASNGRMTNIMKFLKARLSSTDAMNSQSFINLRNGMLILNDDGIEFVKHSPSFLSTIQLPFNYEPNARCDLWRQFIDETTQHDIQKAMLLQEIGGYVFWPNNGLEKCFFLIGDGGNGKGVFMDTLREVYGRDNCSALPLSSFGSQFDSIMLQYSLVNFASENRVDLRGNIERIKEVTSGNEIVAAHKGVDAIKFSPRCKLITSCNDFFNTGEITHALMRRMCFVQFGQNFVQQKRADVYLKDKLRAELPGILNWCIEGYLRLLKNTKNPDVKDKFTPTEEDTQLKHEFMRSTNPVAFFIEEKLMDTWGAEYDTHDLYRKFKVWAEDAGYKTLSLGAFTNRIKRVMRELRPEVLSEDRRHHTWLKFPLNFNPPF